MIWINKSNGEEMDDIEKFIERFVTWQGIDENQMEAIRARFMAGFCWHFAHMLQTTFDRGTVVWAAPFGHICFQDTNGKVYDIEGRRDIKDDETYYYIPESYLKDMVNDFKHTDMSYDASAEELIDICKRYCQDTGVKYEPSIESYYCRRNKAQ